MKLQLFKRQYGLRRSEVLGLRWQDIDFEKDTMTIQHTVIQGLEGQYYTDNTKSETMAWTFKYFNYGNIHPLEFSCKFKHKKSYGISQSHSHLSEYLLIHSHKYSSR